MYKNILKQLAKQPYFTLTSIKQLVSCNENNTAKLAHRWIKTNKIMRLKKGIYMANEFYLRHSGQIGFLEMLSVVIQPFSYLSREYILQKHEMLTSINFLVTAITNKNTQNTNNKIGGFSYKHIKLTLYTGFTKKQYFNIPCFEASKAKALFDYLYLKPLPLFMRTKNYNIAKDLRLNLSNWKNKDLVEFSKYIKLANSKKMFYILNNLKANWQIF